MMTDRRSAAAGSPGVQPGRPPGIRPGRALHAAVTALLLLLQPLAGAPAAAASADALARLAWLGGCWASDAHEPGSGEQWMPLAGGTLLGMSRTIKDGRTLAHEFMQIRAGAGDRLVYIAEPSGQRPVAFDLLRQDDDEVVFENLGHDFPQRIIYRKGASGQLAARIEGLRNGTLRGLDFRLRRQSCDAQLQRPAGR